MLSQAKFHYLWGLWGGGGGELSELSGEIPEQLENTSITLNFNYHHLGKKNLYLFVLLKLNNWWN